MGLEGIIGQSMANDANRAMAGSANAINYQMWREQLEWNKPINQVARLKEAGLNPALAYGNGSVANTTGPGPQWKPAQVNWDTNIGEGGMLKSGLDALGKYYTIKNQSKQNQLLDSQRRQVDAQAAKVEAEAKAQNNRNELMDSLMSPYRGAKAIGGALWEHGWKDMWDSFMGRHQYELEVKGGKD